MNHISVILAEDHVIVREGLKALVTGCQDIEMAVIAETDNGRAAVELCRELNPDFVIMDITLPELNGIEATRQILDIHPDIKVIALSIHARKSFIVDMFKAGACGYILKEAAFDELIHAVKAILAGQTYLSAGLGNVADDIVNAGQSKQPNKEVHLTPREREVAQLLAEGKSNKEIAAIIHRSPKTVDMHRQHIMNKLDLHNLAEITKYAIREGLTTF